MERTPLNKAHEAGRKAVKLVKKGQLAEATTWHLTAATILHELVEGISQDSLCKISLEEQVNFHNKQAELTKALKNFIERGPTPRDHKMSSNQENRRKILQPITQPVLNPQPYFVPHTHPDIFKQIDEADSLLQYLSGKKTTVVVPSREVQRTHSADEALGTKLQVEFARRPKNDAEVIEELRTVNSNLRALVDKLLTELNESRDENKELRRRLEEYEIDIPNASNKWGRQLVGEGSTFSSASQELLTEAESLRQSIISRKDMEDDIPEFGPLEDPDFDVEDFKSYKKM